MGKPSAPESPDYVGAAKTQGEENRAVSKEDWLRTLGTQSDAYKTTSTVADPNSVSGYNTTTTLNPEDQARLDQQRKLMSSLLGVGDSTINQVSESLGKKIDTSGLPALKGSVDYEKMGRAGITGGTDINTKLNTAGLQNLNDPTAVRQKMMDDSYRNFASRFEPAAARQQEQERARIANMGGVTSSDASRQQMSDLLQSQNDARSSATFEAQKAGQDAAAQIEAQQLANRAQTFGERGTEMGMNNSAVAQALGLNNAAAQQDNANAAANANLSNATRGQGLQELQQLRQMPLNELMAMLSGTQVQGGNFGQQQGSSTIAAPLFQGTQAQGAWDQNKFNQEMGSYNNMISGLTSMGGAAMKMSDRRLKSNIVLVGFTPGMGLPVYEYDINGARDRGVMADEVPAGARALHPSGYWMVDYSKVN
jgi:hypothetical protein